MIDSSSPQLPDPNLGAPASDSAGSPAGSGTFGNLSDLYSDLFETPTASPAAAEPMPGSRPVQPPVAETPQPTSPPPVSQPRVVVPPPSQLAPTQPTPIPPADVLPALRSPATLEESGLSLSFLCDMVLKQLYFQGNLLGIDISREIRLPYQIVDEGLEFLKDEKCIEVASGELIGRASYRFNLTDLGRSRAKEAFEQCRYVGPAPVPLEDYDIQCRQQNVSELECSPEALMDAFSGLIIRDGLLEEVGPAVCSGKSIFIYGPPGNGKTMIAKGLGKFLNTNGGDIYVPYSILAENGIITLFDPTIHETTDNEEYAARIRPGGLGEIIEDPNAFKNTPDLRWRRVRRPVVITGGELTLDMLDLRYNKTSNLYSAPLHIKANCGVFLIDDFGRQIVSPRDLLNRWILPLEERIDFLTLATGKKFSVPFEQLIIFSTNLDPRELVDEAFLRRIRHKILIGPPERELFTQIFQLCCQQRSIEYNPVAVDYLYSTYYDQGKLPRSSDPRDLLDILKSICRFKKQQPLLSPEMMAEAAQKFFCQL